MTGPQVSFLLPVRDPSPFVAETIQSILNQEFENWELVLVADGPARQAVEAASLRIPKDKLRLVQHDESRGIAAALNAGLSVARGQYIARIDADDVCHAARLSLQVAFLENCHEVALVGSSARLIDERGREIGRRSVLDGGDVGRFLHSKNRLMHPSVLMKRDVILGAGGYNEHCHLREDYELWLRISRTHRIANLPDYLIDYRIGLHQSSRGRPTLHALNQIGRLQLLAARSHGVSWPTALWATFCWRVAQRPVISLLLQRTGASSRRGVDAT